MTTSASDEGPFPQSAIETNQAGRLTDQQRTNWRSRSRGVRKTELGLAAILVIIGALVAFSAGPPKDATLKPIVGIVCFVIAALLIVRALTGGDSITNDVRAGKVASVDGAIIKRVLHSETGRSSSETYFLDVAGMHFQTGSAGFHAAPDAGYVRIFYLPRSKRVVNLQRLPDPVIPDLTAASAQSIMQNLVAATHKHDEVSLAETRAQMAAMGAQMKAQMQGSTTPPPADQQDARPLAEAIVGSWSNGFISVVFGADGTVSGSMPNGHQMSGRWSVDAQGQLRSDAFGKDETAPAWVAGTTLTISAQGRAMAFQRQN
jgi:hypothetical protein